MFHYQDVIVRLRRDEGRRLIQAALHMGPRKIDEIRRLAKQMKWLDASTELRSQEEILAVLEASRKPRQAQVSKVEPFRALVLDWVKRKMEAQTIWSHLNKNHGYTGSPSSVRRFVRKLAATLPDPVVRLHYSPGEVAQVDFGSGPLLPDPVTGKPRKTHFFVMTLTHSRHQYAEIVWDQTATTGFAVIATLLSSGAGCPPK